MEKATESTDIKKGDIVTTPAKLSRARKQAMFVENFTLMSCNIAATCKAMNINRTTYYKWIKKYPRFAAKCFEAEESLIDLAETQLFANIREGKETSLIFFLCNKGKRRGWQSVHKIELSEIPVKIDELTSEELEQKIAEDIRALQKIPSCRRILEEVLDISQID